jgi:hypothetical protein
LSTKPHALSPNNKDVNIKYSYKPSPIKPKNKGDLKTDNVSKSTARVSTKLSVEKTSTALNNTKDVVSNSKSVSVKSSHKSTNKGSLKTNNVPKPTAVSTKLSVGKASTVPYKIKDVVLLDNKGITKPSHKAISKSNRYKDNLKTNSVSKIITVSTKLAVEKTSKTPNNTKDITLKNKVVNVKSSHKSEYKGDLKTNNISSRTSVSPKLAIEKASTAVSDNTKDVTSKNKGINTKSSHKSEYSGLKINNISKRAAVSTKLAVEKTSTAVSDNTKDVTSKNKGINTKSSHKSEYSGLKINNISKRTTVGTKLAVEKTSTAVSDNTKDVTSKNKGINTKSSHKSEYSGLKINSISKRAAVSNKLTVEKTPTVLDSTKDAISKNKSINTKSSNKSAYTDNLKTSNVSKRTTVGTKLAVKKTSTMSDNTKEAKPSHKPEHKGSILKTDNISKDTTVNTRLVVKKTTVILDNTKDVISKNKGANTKLSHKSVDKSKYKDSLKTKNVATGTKLFVEKTSTVSDNDKDVAANSKDVNYVKPLNKPINKSNNNLKTNNVSKPSSVNTKLSVEKTSTVSYNNKDIAANSKNIDYVKPLNKSINKYNNNLKTNNVSKSSAVSMKLSVEKPPTVLYNSADVVSNNKDGVDDIKPSYKLVSKPNYYNNLKTNNVSKPSSVASTGLSVEKTPATLDNKDGTSNTKPPYKPVNKHRYNNNLKTNNVLKPSIVSYNNTAVISDNKGIDSIKQLHKPADKHKYNNNLKINNISKPTAVDTKLFIEKTSVVSDNNTGVISDNKEDINNIKLSYKRVDKHRYRNNLKTNNISKPTEVSTKLSIEKTSVVSDNNAGVISATKEGINSIKPSHKRVDKHEYSNNLKTNNISKPTEANMKLSVEKISIVSDNDTGVISDNKKSINNIKPSYKRVDKHEYSNNLKTNNILKPTEVDMRLSVEKISIVSNNNIGVVSDNKKSINNIKPSHKRVDKHRYSNNLKTNNISKPTEVNMKLSVEKTSTISDNNTGVVSDKKSINDIKPSHKHVNKHKYNDNLKTNSYSKPIAVNAKLSVEKTLAVSDSNTDAVSFNKGINDVKSSRKPTDKRKHNNNLKTNNISKFAAVSMEGLSVEKTPVMSDNKGIDDIKLTRSSVNKHEYSDNLKIDNNISKFTEVSTKLSIEKTPVVPDNNKDVVSDSKCVDNINSTYKPVNKHKHRILKTDNIKPSYNKPTNKHKHNNLKTNNISKSSAVSTKLFVEKISIVSDNIKDVVSNNKDVSNIKPSYNPINKHKRNPLKTNNVSKSTVDHTEVSAEPPAVFSNTK